MARSASGARRPLRWLAVGAVVLLVLVVLWGGLVPLPGGGEVRRLDDLAPLVQLSAFRWQLAAFLLVLGALGVLVAVLRRRWALAAAVELVLLVLVVPALPAGLPVRDLDPPPPAARVDARITVLAANMLGSDGDPRAVAAEATRRRAGVVALPETSRALAADVRDALPGGEQAWALSTAPGAAGTRARVSSTTLLVSRGLQPRREPPGTGTRLGEARTSIRVGSARQLVLAAHPPPPTAPNRGSWRRELARLAGICELSGRAGPHVIVAGDLNTPPASSRMGALRAGGCIEATRGLGGTWRSGWPRLARTRIDHVLHSDAAWSTVAAGTALTPQSDHLMVWASLVHEDLSVSVP